MPVIRGTRFDDFLKGTEADDRLVGGRGNDWMQGFGGYDNAYGGRGDDDITMHFGTGRASGGSGNDSVYALGGVHTLVGGSGDDQVFGEGNLYGDARGVPGGNDTLHTAMVNYPTASTHTGGRGADTFLVEAHLDANHSGSSVTIRDFRPGEGDHIGLGLSYYGLDGIGTGRLDRSQMWDVFDSDANGVLDGRDVPWNGDSGTTVVDGSLTLRLHEDTLTFEGVASISHTDWF